MARTPLHKSQLYWSFTDTPGDMSDEFVTIFNEIQSAVDALEAGVPSADLGYYDVRAYGLVANLPGSASANNTAFQTLLDTVKAAGGGRIHFPKGNWHFAPRTTAGDPGLASIQFRAHNNIFITGDGPTSKLVWSGDSTSSPRHFFWICGGYQGALAAGITRVTTKNITFKDLWIGWGDVVNPSPTDQNHLFRLYTDQRGDVEGIRFINCEFGYARGDAIFLGGDGGSANGNQISWCQDVLIKGCSFDGYDHAASAPYPSGYRACVANFRNVRRVVEVDNFFTGSDDALLDLEPTGGAGQNGLQGIIIAGNVLQVSSPAGAASAPSAMQASGNDEAEGSYLSDFIFANNTVIGGRIRGSRVTRAHVVNNTIYTDTGGALPDPAVYFVDRVEHLKILGNTIWCRSGFAGNHAIEAYNEALPANEEAVIEIRGNMISIHGCGGISVEAADVDITDNRIVNKSNLAATKVGIQVRATDNDMTVQVVGNTIKGNLGGGSLKYAISLFCDDKAMVAQATENVIIGADVGVRVVAPSVGGSYPVPPKVSNTYHSVTTPVSLTAPTTTWYCIAGNPGDITHTVAGNISPEGLVTAVQGSRHTRKNGDSTSEYYKSTGTGNTGWTQITIP